MKPTESDIKRIHYLIDRYFEASATEAEERELRRALATTACRSEQIDGARAVMGYFAAGRKAHHRRRLITLPRVAAAAVVAAVCGAAAMFMQRADGGSDDRCVAYVGRTEITDSRRVLQMMQSDLALMGEASQSLESDVASQLSTLFNSALQ